MPNEKEIVRWYDNLYRTEQTEAMRPFNAYPRFLEYLGAVPGRRLLDVGCGTGFLLLSASKRGLKTFGVDISEEAMKIARKVSPESFFSSGEGGVLRFNDGFFDYVSCLGALEHFLDMNKGLQEMKRVGRKDALFIIMVPNSNFVFWKLSGKAGTPQQAINEKLLSLREWKKLLVNNGFCVLKIYQDTCPAENIRIFSSQDLFGIIKRTIQKLIWFFLPLNYTYQFIFILKKK